MSNWQPIETAPRDGTRIMVWDAEVKSAAFARWQENDSWPTGWRSGLFVHSDSDFPYWQPEPQGPEEV